MIMKMKRYGVMAVILGVCAVGCLAGDNAKYSALAGVKGCRVDVQILCHTTDKRFGLKEDILQMDAEAGLQQNGIRVLSQRECEQTAGRPILSIKVFLATREGLKTAAVHTEVNFMEDAELKREPKLSCPAIVWGIRNETLLDMGNLKEGVRQVVKDMVDAFCKDYLAANPKDAAGEGERSSLEDLAPKTVWVKCNNPNCGAEYQIDGKDYFEHIRPYEGGSIMPPPLICEKCGEQSVFRAMQCKKCGKIFFMEAVSEDYPDKCPECGYSRIEELRSKRKLKTED
jgi:ribosomal protein L40E